MFQADVSLICSVLHCGIEFFANSNTKEKDLLISSMSRGSDNEKSMNVKAKIQDFPGNLFSLEIKI